jgi:hypothetical protein
MIILRQMLEQSETAHMLSVRGSVGVGGGGEGGR